MIHHYGISEISYNKLVWALIRDGAPQALGWSQCQFLSNGHGGIYADWIHPGAAGGMLVFDLLAQARSSPRLRSQAGRTPFA